MNIDEIMKRPFNVFLGAGISKNRPSNAPLWSELCISLTDAIIAAIRHERWPGFDGLPDYTNIIGSYSFRPEHFWQLILRQTSIEFVSKCFEVLSSGEPNSTHISIAKRFTTGNIRNIITTNFDEYIEGSLGSEYSYVFDNESATRLSQREVLERVLVKIHGTLSHPKSLIFTLYDTIKLAPSLTSLFPDLLGNIPLVIAGYSGNDDDLLPIIERHIQDLPDVIVLLHPGSSRTQRICSLEGNNVQIVEEDVNTLFKMASLNEDFIKSETRNSNKCFEDAVSLLAKPTLPLILSLLTKNTGNENAAKSLAILSFDALDDSRYASSVTPDLKERVLLNMQSICSATSDKFWDGIIDGEVKNTKSANTWISSELNKIYGLLCQPCISNDEEQYIETTLSVISQMLAFSRSFVPKLHSLWFFGRLRLKQQRTEESVEHYEEALHFITEFENDTSKQQLFREIDHSTLASFFLDMATANMRHSLSIRDESFWTKAAIYSNEAKELSFTASNWEAFVKSCMNLATIHFRTPKGRDFLKEANGYLGRICDDSLLERFKNLVEQMG